MRRLTSFLVSLVVFSTVHSVFAQKPQLTPLALGREALIERKYDDAVRELTAAVGQGGAKAEEAQLLLGHAYYYSKKYQEAMAAYDKLLRDFPRSVWRKKALFKKADCHIALKQYDKAAEIYEPEMAYIVSDERKEQVADTYLKYANQYFEPPKDPKKEAPAPNFAKAKSLYQKALEIGLTPKRTEEVMFRVAMCDFKTNNFGGAVQILVQLVREYPKGANVEQAKYHIGLSYLRSGNDREARKTFKDFLTDYPKSTLRGDVSYALGQTYHVPSPRDDKELELGVKALRAFVADFPKHEKALQAEYFIGLSYFNQQRYEDAVKEFQSFIKNHAKDTADEVAQAKNNLGLAFLRLKKYNDAIAAWEVFLREHPVHRLWNSVQRQVIDAQYTIGDEAYKAKKYDDARKVWAAFQEKYPLDVRNADIMFRLGMMLHEEKKYDAAIEQWQKVASKYADTESASRAQFMIAMTLEKQDKFEEAMEAYRKVTGNWQGEAQRRVQALRQRKLVVYTERTFTTADAPALKLITRNIKRLDFRAYKVDMSDYFGKLHTIRGVERLDLALIEPDQRWELNLKNYQDFKELETDAPLPFKDPGVYAVVCQAQLDAEEQQKYRDAGQEPPVLEATNIVLISDIGVITKATHNDVFAFAENLKDRKPWADATILISDGRRVIATGKTDKDGVFHYQFPKTLTSEPRPSALRVMASASGHYASTEGNLQNVKVVAGLQPTAYLYTDRPVYRPGQPVHLRGIVRKVENGVYVFKKGDEFTLAIYDANSAVVHTRKVQLNDFGTFSDSLVLHDEAPLGDYKILLTQKKSPSDAESSFSAEGYFDVATYQLEKVRLTIDLPKPVYLRGEDIKGKVIAKYYYGEPLAKRKVKFGWNNEVGEERETNEKGEFEFTIPTRQFEEEEVVNLWARMEEEGAASQSAAYVATVGVRASLSMVRDLHLVGEKFDVSVEAKDLADKPFAGAFTLKALKHEKDEAGRLGEREVQSLPVKTEKDGKAKVSLSLAESGDYTLRLLGQDANGNPLTSETFTRVVGDEDKVRLRILTDTDTFKLGDTANVRVIWRGSEKSKQSAVSSQQLALVTYEGERIYGYQLVTLKKGENEVKVPLTSPLAPYFQFSIALMDGNEFHEASKWFRVERELRVKVKAVNPSRDGNGAAYRPGDKVRVVIETTDQNGKPIAAELSLAVVDEALWAIVGEEEMSSWVHEFMGRTPVDNAILTDTSCTFHYSDEAKQQVLQVREAESMMNVMLAGVGAGEEIGPGHWAYDQLQKLAAAGLIEGYADGTYKGRQTLNRFEAAMLLNRALERLGVNAEEAERFPYVSGFSGFGVGRQSQNFGGSLLQRGGGGYGGLGLGGGMPGMPGPAGPPGAPGAPGAMGPTGASGSQGDRSADEARRALGQLSNEFQKELKLQERLANEPADKAKMTAPPPPQGQAAQVQGAMRGMPGMPGMGGEGGGGRRGVPVLSDLPTIGGLFRQSERAPHKKPLPEGVDTILALDPQNALLVFGRDDRLQQLREAFAKNLGDKEADQIINALRNRFSETAFWDAHVVTDAKGQATVEFTLPDTLTEWRMTARGVTVETLVGEGTEKFTTSKPFLVELKTPPAMQQGDSVTVTAVLHNNTDKPVKAVISEQLSVSSGQPLTVNRQPSTVDVPANGVAEVPMRVDVPDAKSLTFNVKVTTDQPNLGDAVEQTVPVRPWGIEHVATAGGTAQAERAVEVKLPDAKYLSKRMTITVGPNVQKTLIDIAANPSGYGWGQPLTDSVAQRLLIVVNTVGYLRSLNRGDTPEFRRFSSELESNVARLVAAQNQDGGWSWAMPQTRRNEGNGEIRRLASDLNVTTDAVSGLAQAKQLGFVVPSQTLARGLAFLQNRFQQTGESDNATKSVILYAQSVAGVADFAFVNRLHRLRNSMDTRSLALLALTLANMNREPMAQDCTRLLVERIPKGLAETPAPINVGLAGTPAPTTLEDVAIVTLAIARVEPKNPILEDLAQFLMGRRIGKGWHTPRQTAWVLAALIQHARAKQIAPEKYTLVVSVNGKEIKRVDVAGDAHVQTIEVPSDLVTANSAKVSFALQGAGTYTYSCVLTGFTDEGMRDDKMRDEGQQPPQPITVRRTYTQAPRVWNGKPVPRGFGSVTNVTAWTNVANEVSAGKHAEVSVSWFTPTNSPAIGRYIVLREPIPSGCRVLEDSIRGSFERYEIGSGEITFFFSQQRSSNVNYDLYGSLEGNYRTLPSKAWAFDQPHLYGYGTFKKFAVLNREAKPSDTYRLTPDELLFLGKAHFDRAQEAVYEGKAPDESDLKNAESYLTELYDKDADPKGWKLRDDPARETARMLFTLALRRNDAPKIVRFFEVLRERFPSLVIPFKEIVQTAKAYKVMGERERELQIYRATAESSFGNEARVAGVLEDEGEYLASYTYLSNLAQEYPDVATVESSLYALAQTISQRADQSRQQGARRLHRDLTAMAADKLQDFLALYPENPIADEASFAYGVNLVEQEQFEDAAKWCARSVERYPKSTYADDFAYIATYASFLGEKFDDALKMAQTLATTEYPQPDGSKALSPYRLFALYIAAQIHHARSEPAEAVKYYAQVTQQFPDAGEAADYFRAKTLKIPEVVAVGPSDAAKVKISARNVKEAQVSVYKVDLLKFYQNRRNLLDLGQMNLAGIKPTWEGKVDLGEQEFVDKEKTMELPLKDKGAYFVTVRTATVTERIQSSGIVVRTELEVDVQEDQASGRVRVNVVNRGKGGLQPKAEVWVVGTDNDAFKRGTTDLRGIVFADDVRGRPTVIAYKDGDYAFYRSEKILQPHLVRTPPPAPTVTRAKAPAPGVAFKDQARNLYTQQQRANEGKLNAYLRNNVMGFVGGKGEKADANAPMAGAPGMGGFGGGGLGGVQAGAVQ